MCHLKRKSLIIVIILIIHVSIYILYKCCVIENSSYVKTIRHGKLYMSIISQTDAFPLLNLHSFAYVISNNICFLTKPRYIVTVTSHASNVDVRDAIRRAYPKDLFHKANIRLVFLLGVPRDSNDTYQNGIQHENMRYNDIVQGNFIEAYRNLTYKHIMGFHWISEYCHSAQYMIKMDDDIVVDFYKLFELISSYAYSSIQFIGCVIKDMKPIRTRQNKWYVTHEEYSDLVYPPFISGWLYITTVEVVNKILQQSKLVPYFWIDDVYVTGLLAKQANISHTDIRHLFRYDPEYIDCCIEGNYNCDFLVAPSGGNYKLHGKLNHHVWECRYKKKCLVFNTTISQKCLKLENVSPLWNGHPYIEQVR